jgi:outer membrane protein assembly factor BamB
VLCGDQRFVAFVVARQPARALILAGRFLNILAFAGLGENKSFPPASKTRCRSKMTVMIRTRLIQLLVACFVSLPAPHSAVAAGGNWPQWRGPDRTDVSRETGLLKSWPEGGPKLVWLFKDCGLGYSGPAIVGDKLFTLGARDNVEYLIAVDAKTGKELWSAKLGDLLKNDWGDGPRGTPAVDGDRVYALSGLGNLVCMSAVDGMVLWERRMSEFGGKVPGWGYTESVLVDGDRVVCTPGGAQGAIIALDKKNGKLIWQSKEFTDGAQYASILAVNHNGARQYIQLTMRHVAGIAATDGKLLWSADFPGSTAVIPTPIFHDGQVYVTAGYGAGSKSVKIGADNAVTDVYVNKVMKNHHGGVILVDGYLYGHSDGTGWVCQNFATGEQVWAEKNALGKGAVGYADGMLYCLAENNGTVVLAEASPKGWKEHGRFKLEPQTTQRSPRGHIWTHPVITDGRLYLRDQDLLYCFDVKMN